MSSTMDTPSNSQMSTLSEEIKGAEEEVKARIDGADKGKKIFTLGCMSAPGGKRFSKKPPSSQNAS